MFTKKISRIVEYEKDIRAAFQSLPRRSNDKRRFSSLGNRNNDIPLLHSRFNKLVLAKLRKIFKTLDRFDHRIISARHHTDDTIFIIGNRSE